MSQQFLGEIRMVGYNFAPKFFAFCNGQILSIAQNQALFALLGTTYGGNGVTTFALPDMRGRTPIHWGTGPQGTVNLGQAGGEAAHTLGLTELPAHNHPLTGASAPAGAQHGPTGNYYGAAQKSGTDFSLYAGGNAASAMNPGVVGSAGGSQPHPNMQPYQVVSFVIAIIGFFPSRN